MSKWALMCWTAAAILGTSGGLLWVYAVSGPSPAPVMDLDIDFSTSSNVIGAGGGLAVSGTTSIVGGPSPATVDITFDGETADAHGTMRLHTVLKRDGTWRFNLPYVPAGNGYGTGTVSATVSAGGKTATETASLTVTGGDFPVDVAPSPGAWLYENDGAKTDRRHTVTFTVAATPDPDWWGDHNFTYNWKSVVNPHTGKALELVAGGGGNDATATYAAPQAPAASAAPYVVTCEVIDEIGSGGWVWHTDEAMGAGTISVRLLGDANGDGSVTVTDFSVWKAQNGQTGEGLSGDFNGDGQVTVTDFSIWRTNNGKTVAD